MEITEVLEEYDFTDCPIIKGSALKALEDPNGEWGDKIMELMDTVDSYIPDPQRDTDKPFLMPVEDVFSITGRGTVATGRVERGVLHLSDEVEIVGVKEETRKVVVTGIEMFRKLLDEAQAGDNIGCLLRGVQRNEIERGQGARFSHKEIHSSGLRTDKRRRWSSYTILQQLPSTVLLQNNRYHRRYHPSRRYRNVHAW